MQAGKVKLKCLATIAGLYWKTAEIQLAQEHPKLSQVLQVEGENVRLHCKENPIYVFLFWELPGLSPTFHILVYVSDLYIPRIGPHISCSRIGRPILEIYKSLTDI